MDDEKLLRLAREELLHALIGSITDGGNQLGLMLDAVDRYVGLAIEAALRTRSDVGVGSLQAHGRRWTTRSHQGRSAATP